MPAAARTFPITSVSSFAMTFDAHNAAHIFATAPGRGEPNRVYIRIDATRWN